MDITVKQAQTVKGAVLKYRMDRSSPDDVMTVKELADFINQAMPPNIPISAYRLRSWIHRNKADRIYLTLMEQVGGEPAELARRILATNPALFTRRN